MKKILTLIAMCMLTFSACANENANKSKTAKTENAVKMEQKIVLNMNGKNIQAILYDNEAARSFEKLLPYKVSVYRAEDDLCGSVSENLKVNHSEDSSTWKIGEIGWFDGWFTILCDNEDGMRKRKRTLIAKIVDEDISFVQSLSGSVNITISLK